MPDINVRLQKTDHFFVQLWIEQGKGVSDGCGQPQTDTVVRLSFEEARKLSKELTNSMEPFTVKEY